MIVLRGFYTVLKKRLEDLRFVMLTGVTRYALLWQSGVLNHLIDLTVAEERADICGFTYGEFDKCFEDRFQVTMEKFKENGLLDKNCGIAEFREAIFKMYDGYSWDGKTRVLNPYSLLKAFYYKDLRYYWSSHEPSRKILRAIMSKNLFAFTADKLRDLSLKSIDLNAEIDSMASVSSLFQTGYLTIDKITAENNNRYYSFKPPNEEVVPQFAEEFSNSLFNFLRVDKEEQTTEFTKAIKADDSDKLSVLLDSFFCAIPAALHIPKEAYYHSVLYGYLKGLDKIQAFPETPGADGNPDIICVIDGDLYVIIELKYLDAEYHPVSIDQKAKEAMNRLAILALETKDAKKYLRPYLAKAKKY